MMRNLAARGGITALTIRNSVLTLARRMGDRVAAGRNPDRGDSNIPNIVWIIAAVTLALAGVAAYTALFNSKLSSMTGL